MQLQPLAEPLVKQLALDLADLRSTDQHRALLKRFELTQKFIEILDVFSESAIVPLPAHVRELVRVSNQVCRLKIEGERESFGTGLLIGKRYVLTAAHLFFDEDGNEIDPSRAGRVALEFGTTFVGHIAAAGVPRSYKLGTDWAVDPARKSSGQASREVKDLDYAIIKLADNAADEPVGVSETRSFTRVPLPKDAPLLRTERPLRTLQYVDAQVLRTSAGAVAGIADGGLRMRYSASTVDGASGAPIFDDRMRLAALHIGGPFEPSIRRNEALPIRRVAESIPPAVRDLLNAP